MAFDAVPWPPRFRGAVALAAASALGGCSTLGVLNAVEPKGEVAIHRDLAYGSGARDGVDVYAPTRADGHAPIVVFFYGGGWDSGKRQDYAFVGKALASRGYVAVIPDYRLYPEVRWPAFVQDGARAVRWAHDHGAEYGGDPGRLVLMGHSAGAYNAAMLAVDGRWLGAVGLNPRRDVRALVGLAGPYDFLPLVSDELKIIFGPEQQRPDSQPINHLSPGLPPMWLGTDYNDKLVQTTNTTRMAAAVRAKGGTVEEHYYRRTNHALMVGVLAAPLRFIAPVLKDVSAFIDAQTATPQPAPKLATESRS